MSKLRFTVLSALALGALSACVQTANELPSRAHTDRVMSHGFDWASGVGGIEFVMSVQNVGGTTAVCGTQYQSGVSTAGLSAKVMADYTLMMNGQRMIEGLSFFKRVNSSEALETSAANCRDTGIPWSDAFLTAPADLGGSKRFY